MSEYILYTESQVLGNVSLRALLLNHTNLNELRIKDYLKVYVSLVVDNFSRSVLAWSVAPDKKPIHTMLNLQQVYLQYLKNKEYTRLISFSNSMVEAINKKLKYEYWLMTQNYTLETFTKLTETSIIDYNNRPHGELKGLTPHEALSNKPCPNYALEIKDAAKIRIIINNTSN